MSNEILVVGATGKVGRHVVGALRARGAPVRPAGRAVPGGTLFDWDSPATWAPALAGVERAYLVNPQLTTRPDERLGEFLSVAAGTGLRRVVLLSAYGVEHAEGSGLRASEKLVEGSGLDWTILRPNWFLQNFSEGFLAPAIAESAVVSAPAGDGAVSFVDTRDIAEVAARALTADGHAGQGYTLTGPAAVTFAEVAAAISAAGRAVRYVETSPQETEEALLGSGVPADYAQLMLLLYSNIRAGWSAGVTDTVERVTGRPPVDLAGYVRDHARVWRTAQA